MIWLLLAACTGQGTWTLTTWGEDYIEEGIPSSDFADGCEVVFDRFEVVQGERALLDGDGAVAGEIPGSDTWDLTLPGPQLQGSAEVSATHYDRVRVRVAPFEQSSSISVAGVLSCGEEEVDFDWSFDTDTTYLCEPEGLSIAAAGEGVTELTIHGDHLFYNALEDPDAVLRGAAILAADADADGRVDLQELAAVSVAELGYSVGSQSHVVDLEQFIASLTRTLGHVDGEGHCQIEL